MKENLEEESVNLRTRTESDSPVLHHFCILNLLGVTRAVVSLCVGLVFAVLSLRPRRCPPPRNCCRS